MSVKVDQFCDRLRDRLNTIEQWLESVMADNRSTAVFAPRDQPLPIAGRGRLFLSP